MEVISIGRAPHNDIMIDDPGVSRTHCQIIKDDNGNFSLIDFNSSNGTIVNGVKRHGKMSITVADSVRIGNTILPWQSYFSNKQSSKTTIENNAASIYSGVPPYGGQRYDEPEPEPSYEDKPCNYLGLAIFTIFIAPLFGIIATIYASQVNGRWRRADYVGAENSASCAKGWSIAGLVIGIIATALIIVRVYSKQRILGYW